MKFKVENGSNQIAIGLSDLGSYFKPKNAAKNTN
jgi:hypothetical protein